MKKTIFGALALLAGLVACTPSEMVYKDAQVTAVKSLYEPADGKAVTLATSSTAALYFAWEPSCYHPAQGYEQDLQGRRLLPG